jgi:hypothetical protein
LTIVSRSSAPRSGKTYTAKGFVEHLLESGARVAIVDPLGVWWGLRPSADGSSAGYVHAKRRGWPRRSPNMIGDRARVLVPDRMRHVDELAGEHAVMLAPLGLGLQGARQMHDPHLGFTIEWDAGAVAKDFLATRTEVIRQSDAHGLPFGSSRTRPKWAARADSACQRNFPLYKPTEFRGS